MNALIDFDALAAHTRAALGPAVQRVGTGYDVDYWTAFVKAYPAVWFCAQRHMRGKDNGRGYSGLVRQHLDTEIVVRIVVQRVKPGQVSAATSLKSLYEIVCNALVGYQPAEADFPLAFASITDGPSNESIVTADLVFTTGISFSKAVS
jgi:hypothetical protein